MRVVHVSAEVSPLSESGGLGLVAGALPPALRAIGVEASVITPYYRCVHRVDTEHTGVSFPVRLGRRSTRVDVRKTELGGVPIYLLDCPEAFDRDGLYGHRPARDYSDNSWRFGVMSAGALLACTALDLRPQVLHSHDWPSGLVPLLVGQWWERAVPTVHTIHNLGYQGIFPRDTIRELGLDGSCFHTSGAEFWGKLSFLKAGINYADRVTTVSPTYAHEITSEEHGHGLHGVLQDRRERLVGILNGVDYDVVPSGAGDKDALIEAFDLPREDTPILGMVSRLVSQKGIDLLPAGLRPALEAGAIRIAILGTGEPALEQICRDLQAEYPDRVRVRIEYDMDLAHVLTSGADAFLMPSRYEPCGLSQLYALRAGTLPLVRNTGGLKDTVEGGRTGFTFDEASAHGLAGAVAELLDTWARPKKWAKMQASAQAEDFSWEASARRYAQLYEEVIGGK